jgi:hypothetical protein
MQRCSLQQRTCMLHLSSFRRRVCWRVSAASRTNLPACLRQFIGSIGDMSLSFSFDTPAGTVTAGGFAADGGTMASSDAIAKGPGQVRAAHLCEQYRCSKRRVLTVTMTVNLAVCMQQSHRVKA